MAAMPAFKTVALLGRYTTPRNAESLVELGRFLLQRGFPEAAVLAILGEGC